jgi:hypothetical protein
MFTAPGDAPPEWRPGTATTGAGVDVLADDVTSIPGASGPAPTPGHERRQDGPGRARANGTAQTSDGP